MSDLTESKHWRYMDGMQDVDGFRLVARARGQSARGEQQWHGLMDGVHKRYHTPGEPDIDDPATQGCMEAIATEIYGLSVHVMGILPDKFQVYVGFRQFTDDRGVVLSLPTKGEALSAAILAAP